MAVGTQSTPGSATRHHHQASRPAPQPDAQFVPPPVHRGRTLLLAAASFLLSLALTCWAESTITDVHQGVLQYAGKAVTAERTSRLAELFVHSGQIVDRGEPLFALTDEHLLEQLEAKQRELRRLEEDLQQAEARAEVELAWRLKNLDAEIFETELKLAEYLRLQLSERMETLAWSELLSAASEDIDAFANVESVFGNAPLTAWSADQRLRAALSSDAAANAAEVHAVQLELCDRRLAELRQLREELPERVRKAAGIEGLRVQLEQARHEWNEMKRAGGTLVQRAPEYGRIGVIEAQIGDPLAAGVPVMRIWDEERPFVIVPVPATALPHLKAGAVVELAFPGGERRRGRVVEISPEAEPPSAADASPRGGGIPVRIEPAGKLWPRLPAGSALKVVIRRM